MVFPRPQGNSETLAVISKAVKDALLSCARSAANYKRHLATAYLLRRPARPLCLHLGCGQRRLPGYVNIDCNAGAAVDYIGNVGKLPCPRSSVDRIETFHVIEHIPRNEAVSFLAHWLDILRPGGVLVIECPDFDRDVVEYLSGNEERLHSIFGRQRFRGDAHLFGYNARRLSALLLSVGFENIEEMPAMDYHSKFEPCIRIECTKPRCTDSAPIRKHEPS